MEKLVIKNLINKNAIQIKYILSGIIFTIIGPSFFILIAKYISPKIAILISELIMHIIRFNIITKWVFQVRVNKNSIFAYFKATIPLVFCNFTLVSFLVPLFGNVVIGIFVAFFSATVGFIWNKICYKLNQKNNRI